MNPCLHHLALAATGFTVVAFSSTACWRAMWNTASWSTSLRSSRV